MRPGEHPLWSSFVWRNELADTFVEVRRRAVARPGHAPARPRSTVWLRTLGARIGRGVWCETYWLPEADLVTLGDGGHGQPRVRGADPPVPRPDHEHGHGDAGRGASLGPHGVVLPAASLGDGATVGAGVARAARRRASPPGVAAGPGNPVAPGVSGSRRTDPVPARRTARRAAARCDRYDLDLDYRVATNRLDGRALRARHARRAALDRLSRSTCVGLRVTAGARRRASGRERYDAPRRHGSRSGSAARSPPGTEPAGRGARTAGSPGPVRGPWGEVGWEELTDGVIVAGPARRRAVVVPVQRPARRTRRAFRITVTTDAGLRRCVANGTLVARTPRAGRRPVGVRPARAHGDLPRDGADRPLRATLARRRARAAARCVPPRLRGRLRCTTSAGSPR